MCCENPFSVVNSWAQRNADHPFFFVVMGILIGSGIVLNFFYIPINLDNLLPLSLIGPLLALGIIFLIFGPPHPFHYESDPFHSINPDDPFYDERNDDFRNFFCCCCLVSIPAMLAIFIAVDLENLLAALLSLLGVFLMGLGSLMFGYINFTPLEFKETDDE